MSFDKKLKVTVFIFSFLTLLSLISSIPIKEMWYAYGMKGYVQEEGEGIKVMEVMEDTPAERAGIFEGDIFISVNGKEIRSTKDFIEITNNNLGQEINISLLRNSNTQVLKLVPREDPPADQGATGIVIAENFTTLDQTAPQRLWMAFYKPYLGYESVPSISSELVGPVGLYLLSSGMLSEYVTYEYTGNYRYIYQLLNSIVLLLITFGLLRRKRWGVYLALIFLVGNLIYFIYALIVSLATVNGLNLPKFHLVVILVGIMIQLLYLYIAYFLFKNRNYFGINTSRSLE